MIAVSYVTAAPSDAQIQGLTFATVTPEQKAETRRSWNHWDVINSAVVLSLILARISVFQRVTARGQRAARTHRDKIQFSDCGW